MRDPHHDVLFEPVQIGPVTAPNRFFAVPHATGHGWTQPAGANHLRAMKAEGGWGTVAVQMTEIGADADMANHPMERLWDDSDIPRHAKQVELIKQHGALTAIEIAHGGMRARNILSGQSVIGPSALPILRPEVPVQARAMDLQDIAAFRTAHKAAVKRAMAAGYDIIYVYAAHDLSILSHFLSRRTNHRGDQYGGGLDNRVRLLREVLTDALEAADGRHAIALRFAVAEPDKSVGLRHDSEGREVVEMLAELPDLWDVNISGWPQDSAPSRFSDEGFQLSFTDFVKDVTSKPVVGIGRFTSPDAMASVVRQGRLDLIGAARPSIADPFLPAKIREGRSDEIRECIGCNICVCMDGYGLPVRCTQNPTISEEWRRGWHPEIVPSGVERQHHLIVGGGPAGLECAWTLARAGHQVTLADAAADLGGRVHRESQLPGLSAWRRVMDYRLNGLRQRDNVALYSSSPLSAQEIAEFGADTVVLATGATWRSDGVGGSQSTPIDLSRFELLSVDAAIDDQFDGAGRSLVVYDDDHFYMASVLAEKLQLSGFAVQYVTPLHMVSTWSDYTLEQDRVIARLADIGVRMHVNVKLTEGGQFRDQLNGQTQSIPAEILVPVGARLPQDEMLDALYDHLGRDRVRAIGDCQNPGIIQAAVLSGHSAARSILAGSVDEVPFRREQMPV